MLNVLFISPHSDPEASLGEPDAGGQCVYENELAKALSNVKGIKVTTYCRQTFRRPDISIVNEKYIIKRIECGPKKFVPKEEIEKYLNEFSRKVIDDLREIKNEIVVHSHYWDGAKASLLIKANIFRKLPLVWTPHSLGYLKKKEI